jgi:putative ABC transport system ATP-binding protein
MSSLSPLPGASSAPPVSQRTPRARVEPSGDTLLALEDVGKVYATDTVETHALREVHLSVRRGEWLAIVGPSGSGKTTLLSILGLLEEPTTGRYLLAGEAVHGRGPRERARLRNRHVGFVFQTFHLLGDLTVLENVELPLVYRGASPAERRERARAALEQVGLGHRLEHLPSQLSGGQQQRVAVARAIVGEPTLLLADEPTGNLDSQSGAAVMQLLQELHDAGSTLCMVTHDMAMARYATRMVTVFDGRVVEDGKVPT